jgi:hypothetical protein
LQRNHRWKAYWTKELAKGPEEGNILNTWSSGRDIQLKTPTGRMKKRSRSIDKLCESSWIGAHENIQAREYDAGASPASSEWRTNANAFWHMMNCLKCFEVYTPKLNKTIKKGHTS